MTLSSEQADVVVIGAGPAGATAALTLSRHGARVLLAERPERPERPERQRIRLGEGLPPAARPLLTSLGLWEQFRAAGHLPSYGNRSAWGSSELTSSDFIFTPHGHGWHLDRESFDTMLVAAAEEAGAIRVRSTRVAWEPTASGGVLRLHQAGRELAIRAWGALDCSGRPAAIAHRLGARRVHRDKLVAVAAVHRPATSGDLDSTTLVEAVRDGWWYTALLPGGHRIFVYLTDSDLLDLGAARDVGCWLAWLSHTEHLRQIQQRFGYQVLAGPTVIAARSSTLRPAAGDGWLAAGDAAITFDPLSSQGIMTAIATGRQAAEAILGGRNGHPAAIESYLTSLDQLDREHLVRRVRYYAQENRWGNAAFWKRRARWKR
ncbi:MAG: NAD(P)/FAD-dependent oxidoreductase [Pseudonocardiaceae bacterium]